MDKRPKRPARNAIVSQERIKKKPFNPKLNPDVIARPSGNVRPGHPPDVASFAVAGYDGRLSLMKDFYYKIPFGGFMNAEPGTPLPFVSGSSVVSIATTALFPLDIANGFTNLTGNSADATPNGAGAIGLNPPFPSGSGYIGDGNSDRLETPVGTVGNQGANNWTFEFRATGFNWDALGAIQRGIASIDTGSVGDPHIIVRTSAIGDEFAITVEDDAGNNFQANTALAAVNGTTNYFSVTRRSGLILFHINGNLEVTVNIGVGATFNFTPNRIRAFTNFDVTSGLDGVIGDIRFSSGAVYDASNYIPPILPATVLNPFNNTAAFAFEVQNGFRFILKRITIAGGLEFSDTAGGPIVAMSSAAGPNDDFFNTFETAPILTVYHNSVPIQNIAYGNVPGVITSNSIGDLLYGPINIDLYEIFDSRDTFAVGQALNPLSSADRGLISINNTTFCYVWGQVIPTDNRDVNEAGLTKHPVLVKLLEGFKL